MLRALAIVAVVSLALAACGKSCPPDKPCALPDAGTVFDCGSGQCTGDQVCVVKGSCDSQPDWTSSSAACERRPSQCTDDATLVECVANLNLDVAGRPLPICVFSAGQPIGRVKPCSYGCS